MKNKLICIDIVFENCNQIRLYPENFKYVDFRNVYRNVFVSSHNDNDMICCKECEIYLNSNSLDVETDFQLENNSKSETFKRHLDVYKDITSICIIREDGTEEQFHVLYNDTNGINTFQNVVYENDTIMISIKENNE